MARIFISYSRIARRLRRRLVDLLSFAYDDIWYDSAKLVGGDDWWAEIVRQIEACDHFIFLISRESLESEWCQKELSEARERNKHIIPVRIRDGAQIPEDLARLHVIDTFDSVRVEGLARIFGAITRNGPNA
ncbi:MAG: toll/interleukin-1 receptor domain-containing protein [Chloroflexi bacterium]|nr:toll/interleukin-1 receptor domain-containing protein [Chloroflexota bacterium]